MPAATTFGEGVRQSADAGNHSRYISTPRFKGLDGLRALSILAVIWHHTVPPQLQGTAVGGFGYHGVTLFFAISGFLITSLLVREQGRTGGLDLKAFFARRALRIFPIYYAVLSLYLALVLLLERETPYGQAFLDNFKYFATYTSNIFVELDGRVIFYFAWSLATEEQFYLVWPPLLALLQVQRRALALLAIVTIILVLDDLAGMGTFRLVPIAIVAGSLVAMALNSPHQYSRLAWMFEGYLASAVWFALLIVAVLAPGVSSAFVHLASVGLVASCVVAPRHVLSRVLDLRPLAFVGMISYGMYLLHMLCKNAVIKLMSWAGMDSASLSVFVLTTIAATAAAWLSFRYFESHFLRLKTRYTR
jgi:peptidoglycan/LPS O-acetylase OafA/YrhL